MRRFLTIGGVALLATALLLNGAPASADAVSWNDPEGDALGIDVEGQELQPPRPSEPAYDVLNVALSSDGKILTLAAKFKKLGAIPPYATGNTYRLSFTAGDGIYTAGVNKDHIGGEFSTFAVYDPVTQINQGTDCFRCTGKMNTQTNVVEFKLPIGSIDSARRAAGLKTKIVPGLKIEKVTLMAGEYWNGGYYIALASTGAGFSYSNPADRAPLPAPGTFTL